MFGEKPTGRTRVPVVKVRPNTSLLVRLRCEDALGFQVHWLGRRSYVCPGDDCAAHEQHVGSRWSGLVAVDVWQGDNAPIGFGLLELTEGAYTRLQFLRQAEGLSSLLGMVVIGERFRTRGPLRFDLSEKVDCFGVVRNAWSKVHIADGAATLYGLPSLRAGVSFSDWEKLAQVAARRLVARAMASFELPARQV